MTTGIRFGLVATACCLAVSTASDEPGTPGQVLDLSLWKLQLPTDSHRAGHVDEVRQPDLDRFIDPSHFHVDDKTGAVVFRAECGGVTTPGSHYPRSELREMQSGGRKLASWTTRDETLHTLRVRVAVTALPPVRDQVCCVQIHDTSTGALMVRVEGKKLLIRRSGAKPVMLDRNYVLGTPFDLTLVAGKGHVRAWYNGEPSMDWETNLEDCYFKTGCYTQSNVGRGDRADSFGEVLLDRLEIDPRTD